GPGPRWRRASSAGPGSAGWAMVSPVGPRSNTAMSALITAPRCTAGVGMPRTRLYCWIAAARSGTAMYTRSILSAWFGCRPERGEVLNKEQRQRIAPAQHGELPAQHLARRGPARAIGGLVHLHASPLHGANVGGQVVALEDHVAEAAASGQEIGEPASGTGRE